MPGNTMSNSLPIFIKGESLLAAGGDEAGLRP
jgi:hypothetical protein